MGLSLADQDVVQAAVESASREELQTYRDNSERALVHLQSLARAKLLSAEEKFAADLAVEYIARIEANEQSGGWWFRAKRRVQLVQMYFGS